MDGTSNGKLDQLPDEIFHIIQSTAHHTGPRLGRISFPGRRVIDTPHYLGNTSRGIVPHITQDTFRRDTNISGVYLGLEDFIERAPKEIPPIYKFRPPDDGASPLRRFTALPNDTLLVLGARRTPPLVAPPASSNTDTTVYVSTSVGFRALEPDDYAEGAEGLQADIVVALGDIPYGRALGNKRVERATDRNIQWLQSHVALRHAAADAGHAEAKLFAALLPVSCAKQQFFIDTLTEELRDEISGLAFYDQETLQDLPDVFAPLPRLGFTAPSGPNEVLRQIQLGMDLFTVPFVGAATDAGIALDFHFPAPVDDLSSAPSGSQPRPLGVDVWSSVHATDLSPLSAGCECCACTNHHRAYLQHLLVAKEMLGWVLLQVHNHHILDLFFAGVRRSLARDTFEQDVRAFQTMYDGQLPEKTGRGPRIRGYQFSAQGPGGPKYNQTAFRTLNDAQERLAESTPPSADVDAHNLEAQGFAEKA